MGYVKRIGAEYSNVHRLYAHNQHLFSLDNISTENEAPKPPSIADKILSDIKDSAIFKKIFSDIEQKSLFKKAIKNIRKEFPNQDVDVQYHLYKLAGGQYLFKITSPAQHVKKNREGNVIYEDYARGYGTYIVCYKTGVCKLTEEFERGGALSKREISIPDLICCHPEVAYAHSNDK